MEKKVGFVRVCAGSYQYGERCVTYITVDDVFVSILHDTGKDVNFEPDDYAASLLGEGVGEIEATSHRIENDIYCGCGMCRECAWRLDIEDLHPQPSFILKVEQ
jgi:hypothetical protein